MLKDEIKAGESASLEFKREVPKDHLKFLRTVVAFANGSGGRIVFGVDDDTQNTTQETTQETEIPRKTTQETTQETVISPATEQKTTQETTQESFTTQENDTRACRAQKVGDRILELVRVNPKIKTVEMAYMLGLTRDGVNYHLRTMKAKGLLRREGSTKNGYWVANR